MIPGLQVRKCVSDRVGKTIVDLVSVCGGCVATIGTGWVVSALKLLKSMKSGPFSKNQYFFHLLATLEEQ